MPTTYINLKILVLIWKSYLENVSKDTNNIIASINQM